MSDFGPATNTPEFSAGSATVAQVFLEVHTQNGFQSAITTGVPGGTSGPASGSNNQPPTGFSGVPDATAYGTVSNGNAVTNTFIAGYIGGSANPLPNALFAFKNPA